MSRRIRHDPMPPLGKTRRRARNRSHAASSSESISNSPVSMSSALVLGLQFGTNGALADFEVCFSGFRVGGDLEGRAAPCVANSFFLIQAACLQGFSGKIE